MLSDNDSKQEQVRAEKKEGERHSNRIMPSMVVALPCTRIYRQLEQIERGHVEDPNAVL